MILASLAILDHRAPAHLIRLVERIGLSPVLMPAHPHLPTPISAHPDMLLFFSKECVFTTALYAKIAHHELERICDACKKDLRLIEKELGEGYPNEVLLNVAPIGDLLFCIKTKFRFNLFYRLCAYVI